MKYFFPVLLLTVFAGCSTIKMRVPITASDTDWRMMGRTPDKTFFDSSTFQFPLQELWTYNASAGFGYGQPIIADSAIFFGTLQGEVHAVNIQTGKRFGSMKMFSPIPSSLAINDTRLYIGTESGKENFSMFDLFSGEMKWTKDLGGVVASPILYNDVVFVAGLDGKLYCFDSKYGIQQWFYDSEYEIRSTPAVVNNIVAFANSNGAILALNASTGELQWKRNSSNAVTAGITTYNNYFCVASRDSMIYLFDSKTGEEKLRYSAGNKIVAAPSFHNETMYVSSLDGTVTAVSLNDASVIWKFTAKSAINTSPFITRSAIFTASLDSYVYALSPSSGEILWSRKIGKRIKTNPLVWKNKLFIAAEDRTMYCFGTVK